MDQESVQLVLNAIESLGEFAGSTAWVWAVQMQLYYGIVGTFCFTIGIISSLLLVYRYYNKTKEDHDYVPGVIIFISTGLLSIAVLVVESLPRIIRPEYFALQSFLP